MWSDPRAVLAVAALVLASCAPRGVCLPLRSAQDARGVACPVVPCPVTVLPVPVRRLRA